MGLIMQHKCVRKVTLCGSNLLVELQTPLLGSKQQIQMQERSSLMGVFCLARRSTPKHPSFTATLALPFPLLI
jgi:hypothetical protein